MNIELKKAFARLRAFRDNLPSQDKIKEEYVTEYHSILRAVEKYVDLKLDEFVVSRECIAPRIVAVSHGRGAEYSRDKYCDRARLLMKVDAVLGFFTVASREVEVGFDLSQ